MFSTVNGTPGSILSSKTYNPNNIVTIISEGTVTTCINSPGMVAMTTLYIASKHDITYYYYIILTHTHN